jgi:hypothetical protein
MKVDKRPLRVCDVSQAYMLHKRAYSCWATMFKRCYSENWLSKYPTYKDAEICDDWLVFSNFLGWYTSNYIEGWQLDKDLLGDEKLYSAENCCFIPPEVNKFLTVRAGDGIIVNKNTGKFIMKCSMGLSTRIFKVFDIKSDALVAYHEYKRIRALYLIEKYNLSSDLMDAIVSWVDGKFKPVDVPSAYKCSKPIDLPTVSLARP